MLTPSVYLSCSLHCWEPAGHHHGSQEVLKDEAYRAAVCEPGGDGPGSGGCHVPSVRGLGLEPPLDRGGCHLCVLWAGGVRLWDCQHHEPDCPGHRALHRVPQSAITK